MNPCLLLFKVYHLTRQYSWVDISHGKNEKYVLKYHQGEVLEEATVTSRRADFGDVACFCPMKRPVTDDGRRFHPAIEHFEALFASSCERSEIY